VSERPEILDGCRKAEADALMAGVPNLVRAAGHLLTASDPFGYARVDWTSFE
jgi:hypothetical protein